MDINKTVSFSGYRSSKLPSGGDEQSKDIIKLKNSLYETIEKAINDGYDTFLVGMADGFDTFAGEEVLKLKQKHRHIKLIAVLPFDDAKKQTSALLLNGADEVMSVSSHYNASVYHKRNNYLVDNSSRLICYYDGLHGGTCYTVEYAISKNKNIVNLYKPAYNGSITNYHAKYYSMELLRSKSGNNDDRLTPTLFNSQLAINPHQIDAALFAFKSPLSNGVILADEVGLGKTIEAGLVMCQHYAEQRTRQLVICPASLRKQWALELKEKFNLSSFILESRTHSEFLNKSNSIVTTDDDIIITSYNYAARIADEIRLRKWDLIIIDEAHKLRNSYRKSNKTGQAIKLATSDSKKILLTATPLQNNLTELYGLSSVIDEHIFGDIQSFREQYTNSSDLASLKERLSYFCKRTLRKDVVEYIKYTKRIGIQQRFKPSATEDELYHTVSNFLLDESTYAIPRAQRHITTLIVRKVLASSTHAVTQTLETIRNRLLEIKSLGKMTEIKLENILDDDELEIIIEDEIVENIVVKDTSIALNQLDYEIERLSKCIELAKSIKNDTKSLSLLDGLKVGFEQMEKLGANRKALIFTESRRTQDYLKTFLEDNGYNGKIVLFNGQNSGKEATAIYNTWLDANRHTDMVSGSKTADRRNAIIEYFRDTAEICIATEAAAEGVNLQFCSLVINYDLPWNPQRIEQRIGRCHRYGQKHDVVVINFVNESNLADLRIAELLTDKFKLFDGIFGSSDDVLGVLEDGVDFERRVLDIYQTCRTQKEIEKEFDALQKELDDKIKKTMKKARDILFENFDKDVHERLKLNIENHLDRYSQLFWNLSKHILSPYAEFYDDNLSFMLKERINNSRLGRYNLNPDSDKTNTPALYRTRHSLGKHVLSTALALETNSAKIIFDISNYTGGKLSVVEQLKGKCGYLSLSKFTIQSPLECDEHLLFCGFHDDGEQLKAETCRKLFDCIGYSEDFKVPDSWIDKLHAETEVYANGTMEKAKAMRLMYISAEEERLDKWADDMILSLEKDIVNTKGQIRDTRRTIKQAISTEEHLELNNKLRELEKRKRSLRAKLDENEDAIINKRDNLIDNIRNSLVQQSTLEEVFTIRWEVV